MAYYNKSVGIDVLVGKTISAVSNTGEVIEFLTTDGGHYKMLHYQDCCESVSVESIDGELSDLIGMEVLEASERTQDDENAEYGTGTWTFYIIRNVKASIAIRWYGSSNGYYSESVDVVDMNQ